MTSGLYGRLVNHMMAHAIHIDARDPDHGPTTSPRDPRALGTGTCGCGATGARAAAARRRAQLRRHRDHDRLQFADDRVVETALREGRGGGFGGPLPRL